MGGVYGEDCLLEAEALLSQGFAEALAEECQRYKVSSLSTKYDGTKGNSEKGLFKCIC